ncbi:hypothetical protein HAX54_049751, partial [Datura stramonium]|nr:hypothetical protein [Datura stramonium]
MTEKLTSRHSSDSGLNVRHLDDGPSLALPRSSPFRLWATKVLMDRQGDHHLGQKFRPFWLRKDRGQTNRQ